MTHQEYIYTLHHPQQNYGMLNGGSGGGGGGQLSQQQQYGVMHHSDLLQQAASGLLATEAPELMMGTNGTTGVLLLNGANGTIHNGASLTNVIHQQAPVQSGADSQQYATLTSTGSPLGTVLVSNSMDSPKRCNSQSNSQQMSSGGGSKKKRKFSI